MAELKEGLVGGALNLYFIYKFLRILTTPWERLMPSNWEL